VIISSLENAEEALAGRAGTTIFDDSRGPPFPFLR